MIKNHGLYFEIEHPNDYFGSTTIALNILADGKVMMLKRRGTRADQTREYTMEEFLAAEPVLASEVTTWSREHKINLDEFLKGKGTEIVPVTKKCNKCGKEKRITEFPMKGTAFDACHDDCCDCRIEECKRIRAYCTAISPGNNGRCLDCPVCKPEERK